MLSNVVNWFRSLFTEAKELAPLAPVPETVQEEAERQGISIAAAYLSRAGEKMIYRKVEPPKLWPGVIPADVTFTEDPGQLGPYLAMDSEAVAPMFSFANQMNCGLGFPGYAYLAELSQRSEYRAPSETAAKEMTREWVKLVQKGKKRKADKAAKDAKPKYDNVIDEDDNKPQVDDEMEQKLQELEECIEQFKIRDMFKQCAELDGYFGRAQIFIDQDAPGTQPDELRQLPLVVAEGSIKKGTIKGFKVIEPIWTTPFTYNATDPTAPDFYVPRAWFVLGRRVHASRLLTFIARPVPDILKPAYNFSGLSMTQLMEPYVFQWLRTRNSVSDLVHNFSVMILETDMTSALQGDAKSGQGLLDRAKLFIANRDNQGLAMVNKGDEILTMLNVPLSGLDKLQAQAQEHMAAPAHMPLVKLTGITPAGLNADSEGEIQVWYDYVRAEQQSFYGPHLNTILQIIQLHLFGKIDDSIGFEFVPLSSPTVKELSEIRKANAETDNTYVSMGAVSPDEVRAKLRTDPESGYDNLEGEAPTPPDQLQLEGELEGASPTEAAQS